MITNKAALRAEYNKALSETPIFKNIKASSTGTTVTYQADLDVINYQNLLAKVTQSNNFNTPELADMLNKLNLKFTFNVDKKTGKLISVKANMNLSQSPDDTSPKGTIDFNIEFNKLNQAVTIMDEPTNAQDISSALAGM